MGPVYPIGHVSGNTKLRSFEIVRLYFILVAGALIVAAICGDALAWDGSYYLFETLDNQTPYAPHGRLHDLLLNLPALEASHLIQDFTIIRLVFNLSYIILPLATLAASWLIVRKRAPALFVWPALAIGLGTLPGQISLTSEGIQAAQLGWPILLATLLRLEWRWFPVALAFAAVVFVAHPTGSAVFGLSALVAAVIGFRHREDRWKMWGWACGLAVLAVACFLLVYTDAYETGQMSMSLQEAHFRSSVAGMPLYALLLTWIAALVLFLLPRIGPVGKRTFARTHNVHRAADNLDLSAPNYRTTRMSEFLYFYGYIGVVAAGVILLVWASNPANWGGELDFKGWAFACSLPFMLLAAVEGIFGHPGAPGPTGLGLSGYRMGVILLSGGVYLGVLGTQSLVFAHLTSELQQDIRTNTSGCIPIYGVPALNDTLFTHWSISSLAIDLQTRKPRTVVLDTFTCAGAWHAGQVQLISWDPYSYITKWFNLGVVRSRLAPTKTPTVAASPNRSAGTTTTVSATASARSIATTSPTPSVIVSSRPTSSLFVSPIATSFPARTATGLNLSKQGLTPSWLPASKLTQACQFRPAKGWYAPERVISGSWQWSSGEGYIRVTAAHAMQVMLNVGLVAARPQDTVNVELNGKRVSAPTITSAGPAPIGPLALQLRAGGNLLILRSARPAIVLADDNRPLAMAAVDLTLSLAPNGPVCASPEYALAPAGLKVLQHLPGSLCTYAMSNGWYGIEQNKQLWWRWTSGLGVIQVHATRSLSVILTGYIASTRAPDAVDVVVGGNIVYTIPVHVSTGFEAFEPIPIHLQSGLNTITFDSHNAPGHIKGDTRTLATALYNLQLASNGNVPVCALRS
jgi:hypothetical protein